MNHPFFEQYEHDGMTIKLGYEEEASFADPRDCDNLGTMVCWHPDYVLGDEQIAESRGAVHRDHNGSASTMFQTENGRTDFRSMEVIERYLRIARGAVVILPLYLLDHSGISMSAGSNTVGRGDTASGGSDSWGNPRGWDTTMCGFVYTTRERIAELCGEPQLDTDPFYCPRTWPEDGRSGPNWPRERSAQSWIAQQLAEEVRYYSAWLEGSVYFYVVEDPDDPGEYLDSCGGYICADPEDVEEIKREAEAVAESYAKEKAEAADRLNKGRAAMIRSLTR